MEIYAKEPYALGQVKCPICQATSSLLVCSGCKVTSYCGIAHQKSDRSKHKISCNAVNRSREALEHGSSSRHGRFAAAKALLLVHKSRVAAEKALQHFLDLIPDCHNNLRPQDFIPSILMRLGREKECYKYIKWWATHKPEDWDGTATPPHLNISDVNIFEPVGMMYSGATTSLSHLVTLTLLKSRLYYDLDRHKMRLEYPEQNIMEGIDPFKRPMASLLVPMVNNMTREQLSSTVETLRKQYNTLCLAVNNRNAHFWDALIEGTRKKDDLELELVPDAGPAAVACLNHGSEEEASYAVSVCRRAWQENLTSLTCIDYDTCDFSPPYESSPDVLTQLRAARRNLPVLLSATRPVRNRTQPRVLMICLEDDELFKSSHGYIVTHMKAAAKRVDWATTPEEALSQLDLPAPNRRGGPSPSSPPPPPPPSVIFIGDSGVGRERKVWERVIDHLRSGVTVILAGNFSVTLNGGEMNRMFVRVGLPWRRGSYYRTHVCLRPATVPDHLVEKLPTYYSNKAQYLTGVEESMRWYSEKEGPDAEAAAALAKVGDGYLGFVGDVNGERCPGMVSLAMCGLLT